MTDLVKAIDAGLRHLRSLQKPDGSFLSCTSAELTFTAQRDSDALFANSIILSSLAPFRGRLRLAAEIGDSLSRFLLGEKSGQWSFNYWRRGSPESERSPYPDDLDSTACAISALGLYDKSLISGGVVAHFAMMLAAEEAAEGGPYYTWLAEDSADKWKDIDLAVNANIGYALFLEDISLPSLDSMAEAVIAGERYFSPYYASPYSVAYFISRFYRGSKTPDLVAWFRRNLSLAGNPLDLAFCANGLLNLGACDAPELPAAIESLARYCLSSGDSLYPFVIEKENRVSGREYSGSLGLQLALSVAALCRVSEADRVAGEASTSDLDDVFSGVIRLAEERFSREGGELAVVFWERFDKLIGKPDGKGVVLIASLFASALAREKRTVLPEGLLVRLGFMNLCGWIAYTIYDDFLDGEGDPRLLSLANVCLREVTVILKETELPGSFAYCREILDGIDAANLWEILHARGSLDIAASPLPNYGEFARLASRSLGHAIGPIMVLFHLGFSADSAEIRAVRNFFADYIIARQLNDDLRDWEDDLEKGRLSPVVVLLASEAGLSNKEISSINDDRSFLQDLFWRKIVPVVSEESLLRCRSAEKTILSFPELIVHPETLLSVLASVTLAAERTLRDREATLDFLQVIAGDNSESRSN